MKWGMVLVLFFVATPALAATAVELRIQAKAAHLARQHERCAALYEQAVAARRPGRGDDAYDAASCHAQAGHADAAFAALARAVALGFHDAGELAGDDELAGLHGDRRWAEAVAAVKAKQAAHARTLEPELRRLYLDDQADRSGGFNKIDWSRVSPRDEARRERVLQLIAAGKAKVSDDYFHAAMIMQHGQGTEDIERAHQYALRALALDGPCDAARWLAAASEDRLLRRQHKPQKWGTQYEVIDGKWAVAPVEPGISDDERARWDVPPLAEAERRARAMAPPPKPASAPAKPISAPAKAQPISAPAKASPAKP